MALEIIDEKIVGKIDSLQDKLDGKLPIDRLELLVLINSWGRINFFYTYTEYLEKSLKIEECKAKECYDLSKLDVSKITNMENLFKHSLFTDIHSTNGIGLHDGDISNWNVSNVTNMSSMFISAVDFDQDIGNWDVSNVINMSHIFSSAISFNQPLNNWNVSKVTNMNGIFSNSTFNQDIGNWDVSNVTTMEYMFYEAINFNQNIGKWNLNNVCYAEHMFYGAQSFINKYNNSKILSFNTINLKNWFNENKNKMNEIDIKENHGVEIDNFFSKFININIEANSIQKKEI